MNNYKFKDLKEFSKFLQEVDLKNEDVCEEFKITMCGFQSVEKLKKRMTKMYLSNGNFHRIPALIMFEKMVDKMQTAVWYKDISYTNAENFGYLCCAALAISMYSDLKAQIEFIAGFMDELNASNVDFETVCLLICTLNNVTNFNIQWDECTTDRRSEPLDFIYNLINGLIHTYNIGDNKTVLHDIYRLSLVYNMVCYEETDNEMYKDQCYRSQMAGLYINISGISV